MPPLLDLATGYVPQLVIVIAGIVLAIRLRGRAPNVLVIAGCAVWLVSMALYFGSYALLDRLLAMERGHQIPSSQGDTVLTAYFVAGDVVFALGTALLLLAALIGAARARAARA